VNDEDNEEGNGRGVGGLGSASVARNTTGVPRARSVGHRNPAICGGKGLLKAETNGGGSK